MRLSSGGAKGDEGSPLVLKILRTRSFASLSRNSMTHSFLLSNLGRADGIAFYLILMPPERPRYCPSLIPTGDQEGSRGQRPRKTRPGRGRTLKGSNPRAVTAVPRPGVMRPFQGRGTIFALSRGVAPGYSLVPLQGTKKSPRPLVSDITDSGLRLYMLRMTAPGMTRSTSFFSAS